MHLLGKCDVSVQKLPCVNDYVQATQFCNGCESDNELELQEFELEVLSAWSSTR
jgi:hypothetical protein